MSTSDQKPPEQTTDPSQSRTTDEQFVELYLGAFLDHALKSSPNSATAVNGRAAALMMVKALRERCAKIAEESVKLRGGARWALDEEHNQTCEQIADAIRSGVQK